MKRRLLVAVVAVVAAIAVILSMLITRGEQQPNIASHEATFDGIAADIRTDSITEILVEFGDVSYSTIATKRIRLRNTSDLPLTLVDYKATCRCTWIDLPHGAIAPNEWAEAEVVFDSRGEYGTVGNYIEVITSDDRCRIGIWMSADII